MGGYAKLWAALGLPAAVLFLRWMGADVQADAATEGQVDALGAIIVPLLTAAGVWLVPNKS